MMKPAQRQAPQLEHYRLELAEPESELYEQAVGLVQDQYRAHFGAELNYFYPKIFCFVCHSSVVACAGIKPAASGDLLLECYLDMPVDRQISRATGFPVSRQHIVEIGGLAVVNKKHLAPFMMALAPALSNLGFTKVACTVTRSVRCYLRKLNVETLLLAKAQPDRISNDNSSADECNVTRNTAEVNKKNDWGSYYDCRPVVLAGDINRTIAKFFNKTQMAN